MLKEIASHLSFSDIKSANFTTAVTDSEIQILTDTMQTLEIIGEII